MVEKVYPGVISAMLAYGKSVDYSFHSFSFPSSGINTFHNYYPQIVATHAIRRKHCLTKYTFPGPNTFPLFGLLSHLVEVSESVFLFCHGERGKSI